MYNEIKQLHSFVALVALIVLLIGTLYSLYCWVKSREFTRASKAIVISALAATHIQILFGLLLYFLSPLGSANLSAEVMRNEVSRLYAVEHPVIMIIAATIITYGYVKAKKSEDSKSKFSKLTIYYALGLILILTRIPWSSWI